MGSGPIETAVIVVVAAAGALALFLLMRWSPRWGTALWAGMLFLTPIWIRGGVGGIAITATIAVTIVAIFASRGREIPWSHVDTLMLVFIGAVLLARVFGGSVWGHVTEVLTMWLIPFIWGRRVLARVSLDWLAGCIAVVAGIASLLAIYEWMTGNNFFLSLPGGSSSVWSLQRERAGMPRASGAFGHSIALGGALSMAVPFILAVRWPTWLRVVTLALAGTAVTLTFSRLGLIGFALTIVLSMVFLGRALGTALRVVVSIALVIALAVGVPMLLGVFGEAGSEASGSAEYRFDLISLVGSLEVLGISPTHTTLATGVDYWGRFRSIDSAMILAGLQFGLLPLAILLVLVIVLVITTLRRPSLASIALVAQIPAFATVALITQYASFVWFLAGLAVTSYGALSRKVEDRVSEEAPTAPLSS